MKRRRHRALLWLLSIIMAVLPAWAVGEDAGAESTRLTVGTTTPMSGHFGTDLWGDDTSDMDVRMLLHGYAVVERDKIPGTKPHGIAIADMLVEDDAQTGRLYTITIADGLTYNDGTPITAQDYVFTLLLTASPLIQEIGGTPYSLEHIVGNAAYESGASPIFSGIHLLSPTQFTIQIAPEFSPYFYELTQIAIVPYPISVIAPGCEIADQGDGVFIRAKEDAGVIQGHGYTPGEFSADMLRVTLLDPETGYEYNPRVTSGPYQLEAFDPVENVATFARNPRYIGNTEGVKPSIERLTLRYVNNDTMFDALQAGEIDLINKVASYPSLVKAQTLGMSDDGYTSIPYLRSGMALLAFACEKEPAFSPAVRRAIAMCIDKDALIQEMMGGLARRVYGYYGLGQWMASYTDFHDDKPKSTLERLTALDIPKDIDQAKRLLEDDGWALGADGNPYREGIRYRQGAEGLEPLVIKWALPVENTSADALKNALVKGMEAIGISLEIHALPFQEMLSHYYRQEDRTYDMFFLATNFAYTFDPYFDFHPDAVYQGTGNKTGIADEALTELTRRMRTTDPNDLDGYIQAWLEFQTQFAETLPMIPLFSGVYIDIHTNRLKGYDIENHSSWAVAIQSAWLEN